MEQMLMTQALDERDFLAKKITDAINRTMFVDYKTGEGSTTAIFCKDIKEFEKLAKSEYQSIVDNIDRYERIEKAIVESNGKATIDVEKYGTVTIANAIAIKSRLTTQQQRRNFRRMLRDALVSQRNDVKNKIDSVNVGVNRQAESLRNNIVSKTDIDEKNQDLFKVVESFVKSNTVSIVDPIDIIGVAVTIDTEEAKIIKDIESKIKISNATTAIEF